MKQYLTLITLALILNVSGEPISEFTNSVKSDDHYAMQNARVLSSNFIPVDPSLSYRLSGTLKIPLMCRLHFFWA